MSEKTPDAVIEEIRRLAREGRLSIPEIADEVGVHQRTVDIYKKGIPADSSKMTATRQSAMAKRRKYSNKEIAEYFGIKEENVTPKVRKKYSSIKYSQSPKGVEYQRSYVRRPEQLSRRRERGAVRRAADAEARKALIASYEFEPLSDESIHEISKKKASDTVNRQKQRALMYQIAPEPVPESYISYDNYRKLKKSGADVPPILGRRYRGIFTQESKEAMRKKVYNSVYSYLKGGGNPNFIPEELGHLIAMDAVDEFGVKYSGLTVPSNVEMQDVWSNRSQRNKITQDLLKRLGYHTGTSLMSLKSLPWGIGAAATLGASMLPSQSAEASTVRGRMGENLTNPNWIFSMATGLPEDFLPGWRENYDARQRAQGQETLSEGLNRAGQDWRELGEGILNIPERARNLYGRVRSIFD